MSYGIGRAGTVVLLAVLLATGFLALQGCGGDDPTTPAELHTLEMDPALAEAMATLLPFDPSEWTTVTDYEPIGDPRAVRVEGRTFRMPWAAYPTTLRTDGPNSNSMQTRGIHSLMYEGMVQLHPETEEFIPCLASHWKIDTHEDGTQTFTFHIDERAKWADGKPVQADDVYYTWWHRVQEDRKDPSSRMTYSEGFGEPEILDRLTIRVKTLKANWRLFLYFGSMAIFPAREIHIPGDVYLKDYNWRLPVGSGPYTLRLDLMKKGLSMVVERRDDWWAENERWAKNTYNFDRVKYIVVRDREMIYEMFKKRDLNWFPVGRASRWKEDIPKEKSVQMGWIQKRKIYNQKPVGYSGFCFNMRKPPFDDIRVRKAFTYLFNREMLMDKLFYNEYEYTNSIFPGRDWGSGASRERIEFDPDLAEDLLAEAGYNERDDDGYLLSPEGKRLEVTLEYGTQAWERIWLPVKEYYEDAGIKFNLKLIDPSTLMKKMSERQFSIHFQSWGALLFPNPETSWRSSLASENNNNNYPGFMSEAVDELCKKYNTVLDRAGQKEITRQIDTLVCEQFSYAFGWHSNSFRLLFWDVYGHPENYVTRIGSQIDEQMLSLWWFDEKREAALEAAKEAGEAIPQRGDVIKPWAN